MAKRMTDTDKWKKRFVRELSPQHKLLWFYILDDCNHAGIWEVDLEVASIRVGFDLSHDNLPSSFGEKVISFDNGDKWFIPEFIDFQYGELNPNYVKMNSFVQTPSIDLSSYENVILKFQQHFRYCCVTSTKLSVFISNDFNP